VRLLAHDLPRHRFVMLGSAGDHELARAAAAEAPHRCLNLTAQTTLPEMVECLRASEALVTNDTGPMHVAAALGRPVVGLFGPTDPHRTGPYRQTDLVLRHPLPCAPCMSGHCQNSHPLECLDRITPARVHATVLTRLAASRGGNAACQSARAT
jgi:ADP-heptose:LPS heptosyltransferase